MLFINSVEYTPDGRSLITTTGERRFNVVGRSMRDGYNCARIKFVYDETVTNPMEIGIIIIIICQRCLDLLVVTAYNGNVSWGSIYMDSCM